MASVKEHIAKVKAGEVDIVAMTKEVIAECNEINSNYNLFTEVTEKLALECAKRIAAKPKEELGKLAGLFVSVKDCLCLKDENSQAASQILDGYKPLFNATAVQKVIDEDAIIIGKTNQDEFGFGGFSMNKGLHLETPLNPNDKERSCGGSSGGSGGLAKAVSFAHVSLGESTGGSIVSPAALCGVYGLCPTYGRVSRYGLMDYANSLDKIGPMSACLYGTALVQEVISGYDDQESTSLNEPVPSYTEEMENSTIKKVGIITEGFSGEGINAEVAAKIKEFAETLQEKGVEVEEVSIKTPYTKGIPTYYTIAQCESSTNLAKYCGMRYGKSAELEGSFNDYFSTVRSENFTKEAKRRIIIGTFARMIGFRDAYYIKAMKVRTKIINEYKEALAKYDVLITPTVPYISPKFSELEKMTPFEHYMADLLCVPQNLAGMPHMNIPAGEVDGMPVGMGIIGDHLAESKLLQVARLLK